MKASLLLLAALVVHVAAFGVSPEIDDPVGGCGGTQHGCCADGTTAKTDPSGANCAGPGSPSGAPSGSSPSAPAMTDAEKVSAAEAGVVAATEAAMVQSITAMGQAAVNAALANAGVDLAAAPAGSDMYRDALIGLALANSTPSHSIASLSGRGTGTYNAALIAMALQQMLTGHGLTPTDIASKSNAYVQYMLVLYQQNHASTPSA